MINLAIEGTTRTLGKSQGYLGLRICDTHLDDGTPVMVSAWEPTPAELAALNAGASIRLGVIGSAHPPVMLWVNSGEVQP